MTGQRLTNDSPTAHDSACERCASPARVADRSRRAIRWYSHIVDDVEREHLRQLLLSAGAEEQPPADAADRAYLRARTNVLLAQLGDK